MSLRARLLLAAAYLLSIVVIALEVPLALNVRGRETFQFQTVVVGNAGVLASRISDDVFRSGEAAVVRPDAEIEQSIAEAAETTDARVLVTDVQGRILGDSAGEAALGAVYATPGRPEFARVLADGTYDIRERHSETLDVDLLLVTFPVAHEGRIVGTVRFSQSLGEVRSRVQRSWLGLALVGLGVIAVGLALAWILATTLARPVRRLEEVALRLGAGDLEARAAPEGPKEVATLGASFNRMAQALSANLTAQREFVANASHQLRTPLTGLRLRLEAIEAEGGPVAEQAAKAQAELDRLAKLVQDLLQLARASSVESPGAPVELSEIVREAVDRWRGPAARSGKDVTLGEAVAGTVWADEADLGHVLDNLVENAIKYTPEGTTIRVEARREDGRPAILVSDSGPGIPPEDRARVFDRFYRGANGRRAGPGTGLGLAIVAELVRRWGGDIRLNDQEGTCVQASFPPAPTDP